jgi:hypothetical protein
MEVINSLTADTENTAFLEQSNRTPFCLKGVLSSERGNWPQVKAIARALKNDTRVL